MPHVVEAECMIVLSGQPLKSFVCGKIQDECLHSFLKI